MSHGLLWLPESAGELLVVTIDLSQSGDTEWDGMLLVNDAAFKWVNGLMDTGTYMDILESVGIDPENFVEEAENYLLSLMK